MSYQEVQRALATGASPAMLCATCPWDRNCITPPVISTGDVTRAMDDAARKDEAAAQQAQSQGRGPGFPASTLLTAFILAGRDTDAAICPVLGLRLRSGGGRKLADGMRSMMQGWDDDA